jgi:hypothetical protein
MAFQLTAPIHRLMMRAQSNMAMTGTSTREICLASEPEMVQAGTGQPDELDPRAARRTATHLSEAQ